MKKMKGQSIVKAFMAIVFLLLIGIWLTTTDKKTWSYSGSVSVLSEHGNLIVTPKYIMYEDNNHVLNYQELLALARMGKLCEKEDKFLMYSIGSSSGIGISELNE